MKNLFPRKRNGFVDWAKLHKCLVAAENKMKRIAKDWKRKESLK